MDFSEAYKYSGPTPIFSPDGKYIATGVDARCVIRDAESLTVAQIFSCQDNIEHIEWSPNSVHVMCGLYNRALLQIWSVDEPTWTCKIDEGPAGIASATWCPTGSDILVVADFNIRLSMWSLSEQTCVHRTGPKHAKKGIAYSPDGSKLAVVERENLKDNLAIYDSAAPKDAAPLRFRIATTDVEDIAWSPNSAFIAAADTSLSYNLVVYTPSGELVATYVAYENAIGIRSMCWSPSSQMLCVGSYDQVARVLNNVTWKATAELAHAEKVTEQGAVIFKEVRDTESSKDGGDADGDDDADSPLADGDEGRVRVQRRRYIVVDTPVEIASVKPDFDKPNPCLGVRCVSFSPTGNYLATVNDNMPNAVWVWDMKAMGMACVLLHERAVKNISWDPSLDRLAICTAAKRLHFWTPDGASCVHTPLPNFNTHSITWKADSSSSIICDRDRFCVAYMVS